MFKVERKKLQSIYNSSIKLIGKFTELIVDVQKEGLWLIVNVDSYLKVFVPAEVEKTGKFKIQQEVFEPLFSLRGDVITCSFNKEQNILNVEAGTKTELYVSFKVNEEDYEAPSIEEDSDTTSLKLKSKAIGNFKKNLDVVRFTSPDPNSHEYALVQNKKKSLSLIFASTNICTRYTFKDNLGDEEFELCIPIDKFRSALSMIESGIEIYINEKRMMITSDNLTVTFQSLVDTQFLGYIEASESLLQNDSLVEGSIDLSVSNIQKTLDGVRSISKGNGIVNFKLKDKSLIFSLENKIGTTKDKCKLSNNTLGNVKFAIPELFIDAALSMVSPITDEISLRFGNGYRYFIIKLEKDDIKFLTLGPVSEE